MNNRVSLFVIVFVFLFAPLHSRADENVIPQKAKTKSLRRWQDARYGKIDILWFDADSYSIPWHQDETYFVRLAHWAFINRERCEKHERNFNCVGGAHPTITCFNRVGGAHPTLLNNF